VSYGPGDPCTRSENGRHAFARTDEIASPDGQEWMRCALCLLIARSSDVDSRTDDVDDRPVPTPSASEPDAWPAVQALLDAYTDLWNAQQEADANAAERDAESEDSDGSGDWSARDSEKVDELGQALAAAEAAAKTAVTAVSRPPLPANSIPVTVHPIAVDGLPQYGEDDDLELSGRVAFIFDGCVVSGWPLNLKHGSNPDGTPYWEANSDVGRTIKFAGVTHWLEFPIPVHRIAPLPTNRKAHL
jgi:hypothetical protein